MCLFHNPYLGGGDLFKPDSISVKGITCSFLHNFCMFGNQQRIIMTIVLCQNSVIQREITKLGTGILLSVYGIMYMYKCLGIHMVET